MGEPNFYVAAVAALLVTAGFLAIPAAIVVTSGVAIVFRARVARRMRTVVDLGGVPPRRAPQSPLGVQPLGQLRIEQRDARGRWRTGDDALLTRARRQLRKVAMIYGLAAAPQALLIVVALWLAPTLGPWRPATPASAGLALVVFGTPIPLVVGTILRRPARCVAVWLALLVSLTAGFGVARPALGLWFFYGALPTAALLLLGARRLRAVGPTVSAATMIFLLSATFGAVWPILHIVDTRDPTILRDLNAAIQEQRRGRAFTPAREAAFRGLIENLQERVVTGFPDGFPLAAVFAIALTTTVLGALAAWAFLCWQARRYGARRASDQMLVADAVMVVFTLWLAAVLSFSLVPFISLAALTGFGLYKLILRRLLHPPPATSTARTLLFLRVFGFDRRTQEILGELGRHWRYLGPVSLIAGTDTIDTTIEPHEFYEFLARRLDRAFVRSARDLEGQLTDRRPQLDPDGTYRIEDFFCHDDTWVMTVDRLSREANAVCMDLRGFSSQNGGCVLELKQLVASVPLGRVVLLVDRATDRLFLNETLQQAWRNMPSDSPNVSHGDQVLRMLEATRTQSRTRAELITLLCASSQLAFPVSTTGAS